MSAFAFPAPVNDEGNPYPDRQVPAIPRPPKPAAQAAYSADIQALLARFAALSESRLNHLEAAEAAQTERIRLFTEARARGVSVAALARAGRCSGQALGYAAGTVAPRRRRRRPRPNRP